MGRKEEKEEIEEEGREIKKSFTKKSKKIGRPVFFLDTPFKITEKIPSEPLENRECIPMNPVTRKCQVGPVLSESTCNSLQVEYSMRGVSHREGGWPKEIDCQETDQVNRFLKKIEKDEAFLTSALGLAYSMEEKVKQNNAVEIYSDYFLEEDEATNWATTEAKTVMVYADPTKGKGSMRRPVSAISWCPDGGTKIAIAYCNPEFHGVLEGTPTQGYTFSVDDPTKFCNQLSCNSPITSLSYNMKDEFVLAGGCHNGQLCWWDVRAGERPQGAIGFSASHTEPIYKTIWTASKTGSELMTGASDGLVRWWDIRKFTEAKEELIVDIQNEDPNSSGNQDIALSVSCLEYEPTIPAKFMIGTDQGKALGCTKKAKCQSEYILNVYDAHYGPVRALQRNPCYTKNFLTIGDWSARVWSEDITESCLLWVNSGSEALTDGCWSPTRPSLFFTTRMDGFIEAWDIIETQRAPIMAHKVHEGPAHCLSSHPEGFLMCVGGDAGDVSLLELSSSLVEVTKVQN